MHEIIVLIFLSSFSHWLVPKKNSANWNGSMVELYISQESIKIQWFWLTCSSSEPTRLDKPIQPSPTFKTLELGTYSAMEKPFTLSIQTGLMRDIQQQHSSSACNIVYYMQRKHHWGLWIPHLTEIFWSFHPPTTCTVCGCTLVSDLYLHSNAFRMGAHFYVVKRGQKILFVFADSSTLALFGQNQKSQQSQCHGTSISHSQWVEHFHETKSLIKSKQSGMGLSWPGPLTPQTIIM